MPRDRRWRGALRYLGAAALLAVGVDHLYQYAAQHYDAIPTIGTLFALNFASATVVAGALAAPVERFGRAIPDALALAGIAIAAGSLAGLLVSERTSLFGLMEYGYRGAIVLSIGLEIATIGLLAGFLALSEPASSTIVGRRWPNVRFHRRSTKPKKRSCRPSGIVARRRSGR